MDDRLRQGLIAFIILCVGLMAYLTFIVQEGPAPRRELGTQSTRSADLPENQSSAARSELNMSRPGIGEEDQSKKAQPSEEPGSAAASSSELHLSSRNVGAAQGNESPSADATQTQPASTHSEAQPSQAVTSEPGKPEALEAQAKAEQPSNSLCSSEAPPEWRQAQTIDGVEIEADPSCEPDNPYVVAAVVRGINKVSMETLMETRLARDAVVMGKDLDGDDDPDQIDVKLEVAELNGFSPDLKEPSLRYEIAPGIAPGVWVFAPKTQGMATTDVLSNRPHDLLRLPAPVIRVEQGDHVRITLENGHYFPHTIHFHGVDHPWQLADGQGNDGVPHFGEAPAKPGGQHTYEFTPRQPGTFFYHCHVQPQAHVLMGLAGMIIVEENRPNNWPQTLNIGGGRVRHRSVASHERYDREYDLQYQDMDSRMHNVIQITNDTGMIEKGIHRDYKIGERKPDYFLVNGHSFPYTLRDSIVIVRPDETVRLHVLNSGGEPIFLHGHGHKLRVSHYDGVALPAPVTRDVVEIGPAQRADLELRTVNDGFNSYGPGAWLIHDHKPAGVTTAGIEPGGNKTLITYESYLLENGFPKNSDDLSHLTAEYYKGQVSVFEHMEKMEADQPSRAAHEMK